MRKTLVMLGTVLSIVLFLAAACGGSEEGAGSFDDLNDAYVVYRDAIRDFGRANAAWKGADAGDVAAGQTFKVASDAMRQANLDFREAISAIDAYPDVIGPMTVSTGLLDDYLALAAEKIDSPEGAGSPGVQEAYQAWTQSWDTASLALVELVTNEED